MKAGGKVRADESRLTTSIEWRERGIPIRALKKSVDGEEEEEERGEVVEGGEKVNV